jgi:predicted RNA-binding protein associated with RNAse of E/G family
METVTLTYKRPPNRVNHFQQELLYLDDEVIVTSQRVKPSSPIVQNGETVLADNFAAVWFVFTGLWYDVGKVYNLDNEWTGYYCDVLKPVKRSVDATGKLDRFEITDLFLDLWINPDGTYEIQDEEEFEDAVQNGAIDTEVERKALEVLTSLIAEVESGDVERRLQEVMSRTGFPDLQGYIEKLP